MAKKGEPTPKAPKAPEETLAIQEIYPLNPPYAYASLVRDIVTQQLKYMVVEPTLTKEEEKRLNEVKTFLREELVVDLTTLEKGDAIEFLRERFADVCKKFRIKLEKETFDKFFYFISRDFVHYGKIDPLIRDHMIEDISCDGVKVPIYVWHREYESLPTNVQFDSAEELDSFILRLAYKAGRHITIAQPILDASLPDGSRIQLTFGREVTRKGSTFTIRKFRADPLTISDLIQFNTISSEIAAFLWYVMETRHSALVCGGIASGKTTFLNCLSMFIRPELKIVSIEDTPELNIPHENWVQSVIRMGYGVREDGRMVGEITLFDLLKAAVRQRPDYLIVGEIRGEEAYTLFQAMATGHLGMSTMHADSVSSAIHRLESEPMNIPRSLLTTLDLIVVMVRTTVKGKPARRVQSISEIVGMDPLSKEVLTNDVYAWDPKGDNFVYGGRSYILERGATKVGLTLEGVMEDLKRRKTVLEWMVKQGIRKYRDVGNVIRQYYVDPDRLYNRARMELVVAT